MPVGGRLVLKGGETLEGVKKKKKSKKPKDVNPEDPEQQAQGEAVEPGTADPNKPKPIAPTAVNVMSGKNYEQEFEFETQRMAAPKARATPWGSSYRAPPEILHGYKHKVTGKSAEERLDMRSASKADKFCK
eukprot:CAMPEP_0202864208 /NCGR_PEP_ID=MMETSP1391-20130828/4542_1 /ASSEMBLY_ACC=CAM_ASM_000867 /TAXON_ID=1034604 /ORGANISM="Chlamydomonas leiostraca, Strain SAG 11-49" /LENGTH=131 /DNA_ID=CAMNT_0049543927 /DNA_START=36 /DNA_END=431 /DNA_ORIENTATION=+